MGKIYSMHTHHEDKDYAGEKWLDEGVCAVGFLGEADFDLSGIRNLEELKSKAKPKSSKKRLNQLWTFLEIQKGDVIIANVGNKLIAGVGIVTGEYSFVKSGPVWDELRYPHQKSVKWLPSPREFRKQNFPELLSNKLKHTPGITIKEIDTDYDSESFLVMLSGLSIRSYEGKYNEELVKAGLSRYVKRNFDKLEPNLRITHEEKAISKKDRPDFKARDSAGKDVIIECKGSFVSQNDVDQILRYVDSHGSMARYFLIAFSFDDNAKVRALQKGIELFEVTLNFNKLSRVI